MSLRIGSSAPDFTAETTEGTIRFHEWREGKSCVLFSHPKDFTPVCTTELAEMARLQPEFDKRNVKILGLSVDSVEDHRSWKQDIEDYGETSVGYPMIGDVDLSVSKLYNMLPETEEGGAFGRTPMDNATVRNVFVIGADGLIKAMWIYPMTTGRNFAEILRVLDSLQLTALHKVATPVNWQPGENVIIAPSISDEEALDKFPDGWKTPKPYIRLVTQPDIDVSH